jgi:hypothetical protein
MRIIDLAWSMSEYQLVRIYQDSEIIIESHLGSLTWEYLKQPFNGIRSESENNQDFICFIV